ncbi:hypothetical protein H5410_029126 [Solanum commersonii]|uniref:Uncharacterized protein n=1 Tax=Solanum commersonii TaxID=4109 RepID=A0A9J5Z4P2_SOLCO|nr:hypothetical protein H5410_029126 [Solanum commersonii]
MRKEKGSIKRSWRGTKHRKAEDVPAKWATTCGMTLVNLFGLSLISNGFDRGGPYFQSLMTILTSIPKAKLGLHYITHASHRIISPKGNSSLLTDTISATSTQKVSTTCYCTAQLPQTSGICFVASLVFPGSCLSLLGMLLKVGVHGMLTKPSRVCRC